MKKFFKDMTFRHKIFIICLLISLIPVIILGSFCYHQIRRLLIEREETAITETLIQECYSLNNKTDGYMNAMNHILWDNNVQQALSKSYTSNYDMYLSFRDIIDPLFATIRSLNEDFNAITVYTDNPINPHGNELRPLDDIKDTSWFSKIGTHPKPFFYISPDSREMLLIGKIQESSQPYTNVIVINIKYNKAFSSMESLYEQSYGIVLLDENEAPIYTHYAFMDTQKNHILSAAQLTGNDSRELAHAYVIKNTQELQHGWQLYLYRPTSIIFAPASDISIVILAIILLCIFSVIIISSLLSKILVKPIELLIRQMKDVEKGDFNITASYSSNDEIGRLFSGFSHMVQKLSYMIDEVLKSKIAQQKYEMKALQAQINPHFLYNSLSLINGKALMAGQDDIGQMARLLSTFYRTTLNKGKNIITVANELENIKSYINIQFIMHSDSFDVAYDLDEAAYDCPMINLLLQPLVENAICHGIDLKETAGRGLLSISCRRFEEKIIFKISDNGPGIPPEKLKTILLSKSSGYGIQNVHHRIQLFYGPDYGLSYESENGLGTTVTVTIPNQAGRSPAREGLEDSD